MLGDASGALRFPKMRSGGRRSGMQRAGPLRKEGFNQGEGSWKSHTKDLPVLLPSATQSLTEFWQPELQR